MFHSYFINPKRIIKFKNELLLIVVILLKVDDCVLEPCDDNFCDYSLVCYCEILKTIRIRSHHINHEISLQLNKFERFIRQRPVKNGKKKKKKISKLTYLNRGRCHPGIVY